VVGDEILGGHVLDTNTHWLLQQLRRMGHDVARVEIVPDDIPVIGESVQRFLQENFDVLFVCGGIGPTHDDVTVEAVAKALGREYATSEEALALIQRQYDRFHELGFLKSARIEDVSGAQKMARVPEGCTLLDPIGTAPGIFLSEWNAAGTEIKIFVLPGVPLEHHAMFTNHIKNKLLPKNPDKKHTVEIITKTEEGRLADLLVQAIELFPGIKIGSYPDIEKLQVLLRITGTAEQVESAAEYIRNELAALGPG